MSAIIYEERYNQFEQASKGLSKQLSITGLSRLLSFAGALAAAYFYWADRYIIWLIMSILLFAFFVFLVSRYRRLSKQLDFTRALAVVNTDELYFLQTGVSPAASGALFTDAHHPYSYDIDIFGEHSLYQYLNRTTTIPGGTALAKALTNPDVDAIEARQEAVAELMTKLDFRQHLMAYGSINSISETAFAQVHEWLDTPVTVYGNKLWRIVMLVLPLAFLTCFVLYLFNIIATGALPTGLFFLNLIVTGRLFIRFKAQTRISSDISQSLTQLAAQLRVIEKENFSAPLLSSLKKNLLDDGTTASNSIARLARLFNNLDSIYNLPASTVLNGSLLFHPHTFYAIEQWKARHRQLLPAWLTVLGEMEALGSFANLSYNNTGYTKPILSPTEELNATDMAHPLIPASRRVANTISLQEEKFVILTGSNMSGKSTFLRTLAVNMVLARAGSVVCATSFHFYPYDIFVSMRIDDSLSDNESFFYAELKRLQRIILRVQEGRPTLVLLDEILRGTNSNDKHSGTVGLIRKLAAMKVCGIIATHDVTIGALSETYMGYMTNKCFEAQISNDEIYFDYCLKEGICSQLSASFLMRRLGIID